MPRAPRPHPVAQPRPVPARRPHGPGDRPLPGAARSRDRGAALCGRLRDPPAPPDHARPRRGAVPPLGFRRARHQHRTRTAHRRSPGMHPGPLRGALLLVAERHGAARAVQLGRDHLQVLLHGGAGAARSAVAEPGLCLRCAVPAGHQRASEHRPPSHQPMILPLPSPPPATDPPILLSIPSQVLPAGFLEEGILVLDRKRIRRRYLRSSSFLWDVASVLPMELLCLRLRSALRSNRCLRAPRLFEAFERRETRTAHPHAFRIAKLMLYVLVAIHWNACLYFALSVHLGLGSDTWVHPNGSRPGFARPLRQYLHSFYISTLILTTVGDTPEPCREEEFLFVTAGFLLAVLGFATIMGSMSSVIADMSAADASFYPEHGPVRRFLRAHGVAERLVRRVAAWHEHLRAQRKLAEEHVVLRHLPERLRAEVAAGVHLPALSKVRLFQSCERGVLEALVLRLRPQVFGPGEFVCRRGDVGREMYFIREGRLEVLGADGVTQLAVLGEGLYFGEISLINIPGNRSGNRRTADIRSIGYSDLFCLAKEDLAEVLTEFPTARVLLEAKGREILLRMDKLDVNAEAAAAAAREEAERRAQVLEAALEALQTRTARLLAQLESSALKLALRIGRLESRAQQRGKWGQGKGRKRSPSRLQCAAGGGEPEGRPTRAQNPTKAQGPTSVQSPRGVQGPTTARGPIGIAGPTGTRRPTRAWGPTWARGSTGVGGPIGTRGPTGAGGPTRGRGPTGVGGPIGTRGPTGVGGPTRGRGPTGVGGLIGTRGPTGAWAPSGARGPTGTRGPTGVGGPSRGQDPTGARGTQPRGRWR